MSRIDVRSGDGISAQLRIDHEPDPVSAEVYDLSIFGVALVLDEKFYHLLGPYQKHELTLIRSWASDLRVRCSCMWKEPPKNGKFRVGMRINEHIESQPKVSFNGNGVSPWLTIPESTHLIGYIYKDIFFNERVSVRLKGISANCLVIEIKDTEIFVAPGMKINVFLAVHTAVNDPIRGVVSSVDVIDKKAQVKMEIEALGQRLEHSLVAQLTYDQNITPAMLSRAGFKVKQVANNYKFRFVKCEEQYSEVLDLRFLSYVGAGKLDPSSGREKMIAPLDSISRILVAYHDNKMVAAVSMAFPSSDDYEIETEASLGSHYPDEFPPKTKVIEIARLCIHPDYRKGDLLIRVFEQIYRVFLSSDRDFLISSTDKKLWHIYKGIGFKKTGYKYPHPFLKGIEHEIILVNKSLGIYAKGLSPLKWNFLYRPMNDFMKDRIQFRISIWQKLKIQVYRLVGRLFAIRKNDRY